MKQRQKAKPTKEKPATEKPGKPRKKWKGPKSAYKRIQEVKFVQPYQFMLLCKLMQVPPMQILHDFMTNVSGDNFNRAGEEGCRSKAVEYFIQCGYGQDFYTEQDIRQIVRELDAMGSLWPETGKTKIIQLHAKWSDKYQDDYWFKKWRNKLRRKK
jgi:hypothetical protein